MIASTLGCHFDVTSMEFVSLHRRPEIGEHDGQSGNCCGTL